MVADGYRGAVRFGVLGPLAVWSADGRPVRVPELKVRAVLARLLVEPDRPVSADQLGDDLWGADPPANPANALQGKISQLRRALEQAEPGSRELVGFHAGAYVLRVDAADVDAGRFMALLADAGRARDPRDKARLLAAALALWRGPAFADFADEAFTRAAVARLEEEHLLAIEEHAETRLEIGEHVEIAGELARLVAQHPLRERLRAAHMRALYRAGRQVEAIRSFTELRNQLAGELGIDPGPQLVELHQAILRQDPRLTGPRRCSNLPAPMTRLIGRDEDLAAAVALVRANRLVTLIGTGGVGKTRLAIATAAGLVEKFVDGVWLVELAGASSPSDAVMAVLAIRQDSGGSSQVDLVADTLAPKRALLVLDNCEHVVEQVAELVGAVLRAASQTRVLVTSREPLGVGGETICAVAPLGLADAMRLFELRASAAAPAFRLDATNASPVAEICRRLDGIPLALELAATRVRGLGVHGLLARLDDRLRLLTGGQRDAPARHQTLRATIDWSWRLLTEREQVLLRRLAVHADGCDLDAAEFVGSGDGLLPGDVLDLLTRLVDRSLVVVTDTADGPRYRLLESVAEYCRDRLAAEAESERVTTRHVRYYTELAEQAEAQLRGPDQQRWLRRLDRETPNLRLALDRALHGGGAELAFRLASALTWYWFLRGRLGEAVRALAAAPATADAQPEAAVWQAGIRLLSGGVVDELPPVGGIPDPRRRARALWFLGFAGSDFGDPAGSLDRVERALAASRAIGDRWGVASALSTRAKHAMIRGDLASVRRDAEESLVLFSELGDRWGVLQATEWLGAFHESLGDCERAMALHREGIELAEQLALWPQAADRMSWLGRALLLVGDHAQAEQMFELARQLAVRHSYKPGEVFAELGLAQTARRAGKLDRAESHLRRVLAWSRHAEGGMGLLLVMALAELGFTAEQAGDAEAAQARHTEALDIAKRLGHRHSEAHALEGIAGARALAGDHGGAAELLDDATAVRGAVAVPPTASERIDLERITERIGAARRATGSEP